MKKRVLSMIFAAILCVSVTACQPSSTTEEVDQLAETIGGAFLTPSETVMSVMAGTWNVDGSDDVYEFTADGKGTLNGEELTFECGFNEDNDITMAIKLGDKEEIYAMETDDTGYGVELDKIKGGEDKVLLPAGVEFLTLDDERTAGIVGEWADKSDNRYILKDDMKLVIKGSSGKTKGTYSVVVKDEKAVLCLVVNGGGLEYEFALDESKTTMTLVNLDSDSETVHEWMKK